MTANSLRILSCRFRLLPMFIVNRRIRQIYSSALFKLVIPVYTYVYAVRLFCGAETIYLTKVYRYYDRTIASRHIASEVLMWLFVAIPRSENQSHLSHARTAFRLYYQNMHIFACIDLYMNFHDSF